MNFLLYDWMASKKIQSPRDTSRCGVMTLRKTEEIFGLILVVNLKPDEKKEKDDFSVSDTGGSEEKNPSTPNRSQTSQCRIQTLR